MVMTAPSKMVIGEANDRTTKGVRRCRERLAMKGGRVGGVWLCVARCDRFAFAGDRSPRWWPGFARRAGGREPWRASDATHSRVAGGGSGAGRWCGGPEFGGAAAGEGALLAGAAGGDERGECLLDAVGGEVALAEVADLGAGEPVG